VDFKLSAEDEAFRQELRSWLDANLPSSERRNRFALEFMHSEAGDEWIRRVAWHKKMHAAGWVAVHWPKDCGGRGATLTQQMIYQEELERARGPMLVNAQGIGLVGPTLMLWGTDEQRRRYMPPMLAAEEIWCQGYSEPGSGSDLASLQTRAVEDGDDFIVNGQKVWTSDAHHADMCFLLVRTEPDAPKHKGISYLLVDMHSSGITVRPLTQMTRDTGFNEVFFEDVRVPKKNVVGEKNNGWLVALTTLMYERRYRGLDNSIGELVELAKTVRRNGRAAGEDEDVRQQIAKFACDVSALRLLNLRQLTRQLKGLPPGPESSIVKVVTTEVNLAINTFATELLGAYGQIELDAPFAIAEGRWLYRLLASRGLTIAAGSSEIQRNVVGERVLGLPKGG
jgi:alkylation response protein AidB-like acyl-CoA dehydrogenase